MNERDDDRLASALEALPVPPIPPGASERSERRARAALIRPGENTWSLRGVAYVWQTAGMPAFLILAGVLYGIAAFARLVELFVS